MKLSSMFDRPEFLSHWMDNPQVLVEAESNHLRPVINVYWRADLQALVIDCGEPIEP